MSKILTWLAQRLSCKSLRGRLQALVWVAILPMALLVVAENIHERTRQESDLRENARSLVNLAKGSLERHITSTRPVLQTMSFAAVLQQGDPVAMAAYLKEIRRHYPEYTNFGAVDLQGNVIASAVEMPKPVNASDMFWFQQTIKERDFTIGEYQIGRITGLEVIVFGQPVFDRAGQPKLLLFAAMDIKWLNRLWANIKLLPDSTFTVTDHNGIVLFRYPLVADKWIGKQLAEVPIITKMLSKGEGITEANGLDNRSRIYAFTKSGTPTNSIHMAVGISKEAAFAPLNQALLLNLLALALAAALSLFLANFYAQRFILSAIKMLQDGARQIASGDYQHRINLREGENELIVFAKVFDEMAAKIEADTKELRLARELIDKSSDAIFLVDPETGRILDANGQAAINTGYSQAELLEMAVMDLDAVIADKSSWPGHAARIREKGHILFETSHRRKDGATFPVEINISHVATAERSYFVGIVRDITSRKEAEDKIRKLNRVYAVSNQINQAIVRCREKDQLFNEACRIAIEYGQFQMAWIGIVDAKTNLVEPVAYSGVEEGYLGKMANISTADVPEGRGPTGTAIRENRHYICADTEQDPRLAPWREEALQRGYRSSIALPLQSFGKVIGAFSLYATTPHFFDSEEIALLDAVTNNISFAIDTIEIAKLGKEAAVLVQNVLETVDEGFTIIDRDYRIVSANRAYAAGVKMPLNEILGKPCYEVSHQFSRPCYEAEGHPCTVHQVFETGEPATAEHTHYDKAGDPVYVETKAYPLARDGQGNILTAIEIVTDITEKRNLEGQLRQAHKMEAVGLLAGGIAHDFNNILTTIIGYSSMLTKALGEDDPNRHMAQMVLESGERAASLTRSLLTFSRKQPLALTTVDINEIIRKVEQLLQRVLSEEIEFRVKPAATELVVLADVSQIEQVLMNLATNARDAMPEGGALTISTEKVKLDKHFLEAHGYGMPGGYALITVSDTGAGMAKETQLKIFDPFFTTKELDKGTGLGLAIVYGIVKQHQGFINVYSELGLGTTFRIYLPLSKKGAAVEIVAESHEERGGSGLILVAEDDDAVRRFTKIVLEKSGYKVIEAVDGEDAVEKFRAQQGEIDLLLFDMIMPKLDGKKAYDRIREIRPGVKAIFTSGYTRELITERFALEKGMEFIYKPISPTALLKKVRETLGQG